VLVWECNRLKKRSPTFCKERNRPSFRGIGPGFTELGLEIEKSTYHRARRIVKILGLNPLTILWLLLWTGFVLSFDGLIAHDFVSKWKALQYPSAPAHIVRSKVIPARDSDSSASADVRYKFFVGGKEIDGKSVRFGSTSSSRMAETADKVVAQYPVGKETIAYYNPSDLQESALKIGLQPIDFFTPVFLMPFNAVALCFWWPVVMSRIRGLFGMGPSDVAETNDGLENRFRLFTWDPLACAFAGMGVAGFIYCFVSFFATLVLPAWYVVALGWVVVFCGGIVGWLMCKPNVVFVDQANGTLTTDIAGKSTQTMQTREISEIKVSIPEVQTETSVPTVIIRGEESDAPIPCGSERAAKWLQQRLLEELHISA